MLGRVLAKLARALDLAHLFDLPDNHPEPDDRGIDRALCRLGDHHRHYDLEPLEGDAAVTARTGVGRRFVEVKSGALRYRLSRLTSTRVPCPSPEARRRSAK
jgi:hypothetical protein